MPSGILLRVRIGTGELERWGMYGNAAEESRDIGLSRLTDDVGGRGGGETHRAISGR